MVNFSYGIDALLLNFGPTYRAAGISRSIQNLLRYLPEETADNERLIAYSGPGAIPPYIARTGLAFSQTRLPTHRPQIRILWEQLVLPVLAARAGVSALHCPAYVAPFVRSVPSVVTVHDLSFIRFPWAFNRANRVYLSAMTRWSVRHADALVAVSVSTRDEMTALLRVDPNEVTVICHGIEPEYRPIEDRALIEDFRRARGLPPHLILCVATLEPRKNLEMLVKAYARAGGFASLGQKLVLAGGKGWGYQQLFALVEGLGLGGDVIFPGFVPMSDLPLWYNAADLFVYPSRYEGFGMPVLEAMACGVPTVTTTTPALREVAGSACVLVDPNSDEQLAETLSAIVASTDRLGEMRQSGLQRAAEFSWERSARQHLDVYRSVSSRHVTSRQHKGRY